MSRLMQRFLPLSLCALVGLSGCASSRLAVSVDVYDEDPRVEMPISPRKAQSLIADMHTLDAESRAATALKLKLARESSDLFRSSWELLDGKDEKIDGLGVAYGIYKDAVLNAQGTYESKAALAIRALRDYIGKYQKAIQPLDCQRQANIQKAEAEKCPFSGAFNNGKSPDAGDEELIKQLRYWLKKDETRAICLVADAVASYGNLETVPMGGNWQTMSSRDETSSCLDGASIRQTEIAPSQDASSVKKYSAGYAGFTIDWHSLEHLLNAQIMGARNVGNREKQRLYEQLGKNIQSKLLGLAELAERQLGLPSGQLRSAHTPTTLGGSSLALANELEALRNAMPATATSREALAGLVINSSRFFELVDRLQDAGDPVWRTVTDEENEGHWNNQFLRTYFYAEGDAGVLIVRDNPMRYRVQEASNDPTNLIKGQLSIARTVADAAISVAGAATGVPLELLGPGDDSSASRSKSATYGDASTSLSAEKARLDLLSARRKNTLNSLARDLSRSSNSLARMSDDDPRVKREKRQLQSILSAYEKLLGATGGS